VIKLEEGEEIIYVARKHWLLFFGETVFLFLFAVLPLGLVFVPAEIWEQIPVVARVIHISSPLLAIFWSLWTLFLWMIFALLWTDYYLDVWILTNHRVFDIEQIGLFNRKVSAFRYNQIQDVTIKVPGLFATIIGFGTVELRTASDEVFRFKGVANPIPLKERIMSEHHRVHT